MEMLKIRRFFFFVFLILQLSSCSSLLKLVYILTWNVVATFGKMYPNPPHSLVTKSTPWPQSLSASDLALGPPSSSWWSAGILSHSSSPHYFHSQYSDETQSIMLALLKAKRITRYSNPRQQYSVETPHSTVSGTPFFVQCLFLPHVTRRFSDVECTCNAYHLISHRVQEEYWERK